mgnify:CR=1 FL=1
MTFRRVGGVMDTLYSVDQELILKSEDIILMNKSVI